MRTKSFTDGVDVCIKECKDSIKYYEYVSSPNHKFTILVLKGLITQFTKLKTRVKYHKFKPPKFIPAIAKDYSDCEKCGLEKDVEIHRVVEFNEKKNRNTNTKSNK